MKKYCLSVAMGFVLTAMTAASSQAESLVVSSPVPPYHVLSTHSVEPLMSCVKEATDNEIDFNYFPSGQLAPLKDSIDALNSGLAQMTIISPSAEAAKLPINGITLLPGLGQTSTEIVKAFRKVVDSDGAFATEMARNKIRPIVVSALPPYNIMSTVEPIDHLNKFDGIKVRTAGGAMLYTIQALGGIPVEISSADMYIGLQRGTVDATVLSLVSVKGWGVQELVKSMSSNGGFGTITQMIGISTDVWDGLSPSHQKALSDCGRKVEMDLAAYFDAENERLKREFAGMGIDVFEFSEEDKAAINSRLGGIVQDYVNRLVERGFPGQKALNEYMAALKE